MEEKKFNLEFNLAELQTILNALKKLPFEEVAPVIESIMNQYNATVKAMQEETAPKVIPKKE